MKMDAKTLNAKSDGDCGYVAFYKGMRYEVYAKTLLAARDIVQKHCKAKKAYEINILIAERADGATVEHSADF